MQHVYRPARHVAEDAILENVTTQHVSIPKKDLLKRVVNRNREKHRPGEPKTLDFEVDYDFLKVGDFIVKDIQMDGQRHFVLSTTYQLDLLRQTKRWYIDGTFKIVGAPFKKPGDRKGQLFSIHGFVEKDGDTQQFPLVFCLMSRQTTADYVQVLQAVKTKLGLTSVEGFVADFEKAEWSAVKEVFPGVDMKGCAFHWSQAVWRRVQAAGLAETYQQRTGMHGFIRRLLSLQFLPAEDIKPAFEQLCHQATTTSAQELIRYIRDQWVDSNTFPPTAWSVFRQTVRTNNDVEGWHHRLNAAAAGTSLQFYRIVPLLRREAELVYLAVRGGDLTRNVRGRSRALEANLQQLWDEYMRRDIGTSRFLKRCGDLYCIRV